MKQAAFLAPPKLRFHVQGNTANLIGLLGIQNYEKGKIFTQGATLRLLCHRLEHSCSQYPPLQQCSVEG